METGENSVQHYRARAARHPVRFWWQPFFLLGIMILLWSQLPVASVLFETRIFSPLPEPRASYVALDPAYAAQTFKKMRMTWTLGRTAEKSAAEMELGAFELTKALQPPSFLEQGSRYPGLWQPAEVYALPQKLPDIGVSSVSDAPSRMKWPEPPQGIRTTLDQMLSAAKFAFPLPKETLPEHAGYCRFYLETDADGSVAHLLLLSPWTVSAGLFERALLRGRAQGATRGFVDCAWSFSK